MRFENFWNEFSFFTNPVVKYSGKPTTLDFSFPIIVYRKENSDIKGTNISLLLTVQNGKYIY